MAPSRKQNQSKKRRRQDEKEEQPSVLVKRVKVVGPRKFHVIPPPSESLVTATRPWDDPKIHAYQLRNIHNFYSSLVVTKCKPTIVRELDEDWPFDESMDPDLAEAWRPLMDAPLLPFVIGLKDFLSK